MSDDVDSSGEHKTTGGPVPAYASASVFIGAWGLLLAALNMYSMAHPTQHISWGGLLTFETTNPAFTEAKTGFYFAPLGDTVFIVASAALIVFGTRNISAKGDLQGWFKGLIMNDTWPALNDPSVGGGQRTAAAWLLLIGFVFYFWYGIQYSGWIDVGVYSVTIALVASGFALNHASRVPPGDENVD
jgi:hypothetical protein